MQLVLDGETTKIPRHMPYHPESYMVQFGSMTDKGDHTSWLYNHPEATQSFRQNNKELQDQINSASIIIAHNLKFDIMWLLSLGIVIPNIALWCTQVAQYILEGQKKGPKGYYTLNEVAKRRGIPGKLDRVALFWDSGYETDEIPANVLVPYNRQDNAVAGQVYTQQVRELQERPELINVMRVQMGMIPLLAEIEWNGMLVNRNMLVALNKEYTEKVADYASELEDIAGYRINWGSSPQKSALLFGGSYTVTEKESYEFHYKDEKKPSVTKSRNVDREIVLEGLGFIPDPKSETAKTGTYCTDANVIISLKGQNKKQKRFLEVLSLRSKAEKLRSTYFEGLQKKLIGDFVHPSMNQTIARNGRKTCSNPNGQNMPRGSTGPVKSVFISRFAY